MHVIIQAGGKGTRLESLTRNRPKCLVPVNNRPLIFWAFEAFKEHNIIVICDYKRDVLKKYLASFGSQYRVQVISAEGSGTASGIGRACNLIKDGSPVVILWCDLLFDPKWEMPSVLQKQNLQSNLLGLSGTFPCRWSYDKGRLQHIPSSAAGVAGFFVFRNKHELDGIPTEGAFVPWLVESKKHFSRSI